MKDKMTVKRWIAALLKGILVAVVLAFTATESINFFTYIFPAEQWFMAYTGFGLTIGALFVYLYLLVADARTSLQKTVSLIMILFGSLGELFTAGFGMEIQGWKNEGWEMTQSDLTMMIWIVRIMIFAHAAAFLFYSYGDKIIAAFKDSDGDGMPDAFDPEPNNPRVGGKNRQQNTPQNAPMMVNAADAKAESLDTDPNADRGGK